MAAILSFTIKEKTLVNGTGPYMAPIWDATGSYQITITFADGSQISSSFTIE